MSGYGSDHVVLVPLLACYHCNCAVNKSELRDVWCSMYIYFRFVCLLINLV